MTERLILNIIWLMARTTAFTATTMAEWLCIHYDLAHTWCQRLEQAGYLRPYRPLALKAAMHGGYWLTEAGIAARRGPLIDAQAEIDRLTATISVLQHERDTLARANASYARREELHA